jgi:hypothetical protein
MEEPNDELKCKSCSDHSKIADSFLAKTQGSTSYPDFCVHGVEPNTDLKLKGGSRVKIFDTDNDEIIKV